MDRLDELGIFVAIIDAGSLAGAARKLRRSPPAVTRALAALEERTGVRLVERTTRRLSATDAGRDLADKARRLIADYEGATGTASAADIRGLLRITAPLVFGRRHVAPIIGAFLDRHPGIQVELVLNDRNVDLIEEDLHLALRIGQLADSSLVARKLGEVRRMLIASPAYLARAGAPRAPADLAGHETIFGLYQGESAEWRFGRGGRAGIVRLAPRLRVNDVEATLSAVREGRGIARLFSYQVADDITAGTLVRLLPELEPDPVPVQMVVPSGRHMAPKVRAFLDFAVEELERLPVIRSETVSRRG